MIFMDIFQDNVKYSSFTKKKKMIKATANTLLCVNRIFYNDIREYNYYFNLRFTIKGNVKKEVRQEIVEAVRLTLEEEYTMKNFNTFKKYKRDNDLITEYSRYRAMYYYTLYLERGFEDKKNNRSILKWYKLCALYNRIPEVFCKYAERLILEYPENKEEILKYLEKAVFFGDKKAAEILYEYYNEEYYNLVKDDFLLDFYSRIMQDDNFRLDNYFGHYFIKK
ncbi:8815_t:CDS:1 [Cetraspora pellucida]|uniref:8815_t:CDS:1 n=1 Tax=Cetraspora pellucida TaxID=1433469 RepID=A0A9N8VGL6_9GLOM|nr:8815_t:CDS:1 [Cetraspora pellucida]